MRKCKVEEGERWWWSVCGVYRTYDKTVNGSRGTQLDRGLCHVTRSFHIEYLPTARDQPVPPCTGLLVVFDVLPAHLCACMYRRGCLDRPAEK